MSKVLLLIIFFSYFVSANSSLDVNFRGILTRTTCAS